MNNPAKNIGGDASCAPAHTQRCAGEEELGFGLTKHARIVAEPGGYVHPGVLRVSARPWSTGAVSVNLPASPSFTYEANGNMTSDATRTFGYDLENQLTNYGQRYEPEPTPPTSRIQRQLVDLTQWLKQLIVAQATAKTQAEHHHDPFVRKRHQPLMDSLQDETPRLSA